MLPASVVFLSSLIAGCSQGPSPKAPARDAKYAISIDAIRVFGNGRFQLLDGGQITLFDFDQGLLEQAVVRHVFDWRRAGDWIFLRSYDGNYYVVNYRTGERLIYAHPADAPEDLALELKELKSPSFPALPRMIRSFGDGRFQLVFRDHAEALVDVTARPHGVILPRVFKWRGQPLSAKARWLYAVDYDGRFAIADCDTGWSTVVSKPALAPAEHRDALERLSGPLFPISADTIAELTENGDGIRFQVVRSANGPRLVDMADRPPRVLALWLLAWKSDLYWAYFVSRDGSCIVLNLEDYSHERYPRVDDVPAMHRVKLRGLLPTGGAALLEHSRNKMVEELRP
jgi:hypothetical protein